MPGLKPGTQVHRNRDHQWEAALTKRSAVRKVALHLTLAEADGGLALILRDEDGIETVTHAQLSLQLAHNAEQADAALRTSLTKLGKTMFEADGIALALSQPWFVPAAAINGLRRDAVAAHEAARLAAWERPERKAPAEPPAVYPATQLSYLANVYNEKARAFYHKHGVGLIDAAYEAHQEAGEVSLMITRHCLRFSFNLCPKQAKGVQGVQGQVRAEPMTLRSGEETYTLRFDCKPCEMHVVGAMKPRHPALAAAVRRAVQPADLSSPPACVKQSALLDILIRPRSGLARHRTRAHLLLDRRRPDWRVQCALAQGRLWRGACA